MPLKPSKVSKGGSVTERTAVLGAVVVSSALTGVALAHQHQSSPADDQYRLAGSAGSRVHLFQVAFDDDDDDGDDDDGGFIDRGGRYYGRAIGDDAREIRRHENHWRYRFHNGRWWYWLPANRWVYWQGDRWNDYRPGVMRFDDGYSYRSSPYRYYYRGDDFDDDRRWRGGRWLQGDDDGGYGFELDDD